MLDSHHLLKYLAEPNGLTLNDIMWLESTTKKHPFFQLGYSLIAKGIFTKAPEISNDAIKKAAMHALSRHALRKVIENDMDWITSSSAPKTAEKYSEITEIEETLRREHLEDELIASIAVGKKRNNLEEQLAIIEDFIKNEPRISKVSQADTVEEVEDLSVQSTKLEKLPTTESFAKILVRQGKFQEAIDVYSELIGQNPEKSGYFASKIEELQKKLLSLT